MPNSKQIKEKLDRVISAWEMLAPLKPFGGFTLAQFKAAVQPSYDTRIAEHELEVQLAATRAERDNSDKVSIGALLRVVDGVKSDPTEGPDSDLYDAMGYVRKSARKSGLTKKKPTPPPGP